MNNVSLVGRLTKDPEKKVTPGGKSVTNFTVAVNRPFKSKDEENNNADFIRIVVWNKDADNAEKFLSKGSLVGIIGRIETGSYEGQDGKRVYTTDVVANMGGVQFLDTKGSNNKSNDNASSTPSQSNQGNQQSTTTTDNDPFAGSNSGPIEVSDDDLPF